MPFRKETAVLPQKYLSVSGAKAAVYLFLFKATDLQAGLFKV